MDWTQFALKLIPVLLVFGAILNIVPFLVFLERKVCAWIQNRVGPNRVGLLGPDSPLEILGIKTGKVRILGGLLQPLADAIKLFTKENFTPKGADRTLFLLAPFFALLPPLLAFVVVPVGADFVFADGTVLKLQVADLNVGVLWILSVASFAAYGLAFGGWASDNKFALLGGVRAMAQMISYEIPLGILLLAVIMSFGTVSLREMVLAQAGWTAVSPDFTNNIWSWGIWQQPLAFVLFTICAFAENNRLPFDLPECEAELIGGYHTEYNAMGFGMFFQGEYIAMLSMGALIATLFLGGWHYPGFASLYGAGGWVTLLAIVLSFAAFSVKVMAFVFFSMWVRWTLPRFRWDQLMDIGWKGIVPLALANLLFTAFINLPPENKTPAHRQAAAAAVESVQAEKK